MKKVFFILLALCVLLTSTAFASFTVNSKGYMKKGFGGSPFDRCSPTFTEKGQTFRFKFLASSAHGQGYSDMDFDKGTTNKWAYKAKGFNTMNGGVAMQIVDNATGKVFYTLSMDRWAFVIGYDFNKNKAVQYVKSDNYYSPYTGARDLIVRNGQLYLVSKPFNEGGYSNPEYGAPLAYRLFWDSKANWFGYENVGSDF